LVNKAKAFGEPLNFITDRLPSYNQAAKLFKKAKHVPVKPMSSDVTNNFIRPHGSLNHLTPAEVAGLKTNFKSKASWFIYA
ncbi:MAG: IS6 family transposase, partial [Clostridium sp.]|nr:IS6 family transposase [Clostridium sp.]